MSWPGNCSIETILSIRPSRRLPAWKELSSCEFSSTGAVQCRRRRWFRVTPPLRNAALEALQSWRWEPMRIDGETVPASTIVAFNFVLKQSEREPRFGLWIDASGNLWDGEQELDVELIVQRAKDFGNVVMLRPGPDVSRTLLMDTVEHLKQSGIEHVFVPAAAMDF